MSYWKILCFHPLKDAIPVRFITKEAAVVYIRDMDFWIETETNKICVCDPYLSCLAQGDGVRELEKCLLEPVEVEE